MNRDHHPQKTFVSIILLAAGGSRRLGRPKQLLKVQGQSLVVRSARAALESSGDEVVVVVGAASDEVRAEIAQLGVKIVSNSDWSAGLASSIRAGLTAVDERAAAALFAACDQPALSSSVLDGLISSFRNCGTTIVASEYAGTVGIPTLFARRYFNELESLRGDSGAKGIIANHREDVQTVPFPEGAMDVDTPEDLAPWDH